MARVFTITEGLENLGALSTGGQGSVYKAKRGEIISAVKILPTPIHSEDENDKNYKDFKNEVSKLIKVNQEANPNVVKILSSGITESGSLPFIEMEFIEGPGLEDLIKPPHDSVFTINESIKVADQLSNALAHCHKVSVKHGDIKSNNVKLNSASGNYVLLDFGLSIMSDEQRRTSLKHAGAVEFMAPEQNEGEMRLESDVYSFGIILYELLAGVVPFPLNNNGETSRNTVMISHMEKSAPDILELRKENMPKNWEEGKRNLEMLVPEWLLSIIAKCLEKRPENRFRDGVELHAAILEKEKLSKNNDVTNPFSITFLEGEQNGLETPLPQDSLEPKNQTAALPFIPLNVAPGFSSPSIPQNKKSFATWFNTSIGELKPAGIGLAILLVCLVLFAGYSSLTKPGTGISDTAAVNAENQRLTDPLAAAERLDANRIQDSLYNSYQNRSPEQTRGKGKGHSKGKGKKWK